MEKDLNINDFNHVLIAQNSELPPDASPTVSSIPTKLTPKERRRFMWKIDIHVLPGLFALWLVLLLDKSNIGSANIFGIQKDLHMKGNDFNVAVLIVMILEIGMEIPCNAILKYGSPQIVLATEIFFLGIAGIGEGLVTNVGGFNAMRFFVGVFEAGLIPASVYILGQYYPRYEMQWRSGMLVMATALSTAFASFLAFAISDINNGNGYHGWRWIFIVEGCITSGMAVLAYPFLPRWPQDAKWLSTDEKALLAELMNEDGVVTMTGEKLDFKRLISILLDWKIYICGFILSCTVMPLYSIAIFTPTIVSGLAVHSTPRYAQVLCIPIFVTAALSSLGSSWLSDKYKHRATFIFFGYSMNLAGALILLFQEYVGNAAKYVALYLIANGTWVTLPMLWSILTNNVAGSFKMGIAVAIQVSLGNIGGVAGILTFSSTDAPSFKKGYTTIAVMTGCAMGLMLIYVSVLWVENRARAAGKRDHRLERGNEEELGDEHPSFRYTY